MRAGAALPIQKFAAASIGVRRAARDGRLALIVVGLPPVAQKEVPQPTPDLLRHGSLRQLAGEARDSTS
jgi:hypothetical protein